MDESTVAQTGYLKAKHRRALISNMFSRRAISDVQHLIREQVRGIYPAYASQLPNRLRSWIDSATHSRSRMQLVGDVPRIAVLLSLTRPCPGKSSDLYLGFQCVCADIITNFLFATCSDQLSFPDFHGDIIKGFDDCIPSVTMAKHSLFFLWIVRYFPPSILMLLAPSLKGLVVFRKVSLNDCHHAQAVAYNQTTLDARSPGQECFAELEATR
jgi:hypothetical protein